MSNNERGFDGDVIRVTMFNGFKIESGGRAIHDAEETYQLWHLIGYLIAFRYKAVSQDELIDVLWPDGNIENPQDALKDLVYRIREVFSLHKLLHARDMIIFKNGCYRWNNDLDTYVDAEEFEELCRQASASGLSAEEKREKYITAIGLYKGDFLPGVRFENWAVPLSSYYRSMYFKCVHAALELLTGEKRYAEVEMICKKAIIIDQFEETTHKYLIMAMVRQGKQTQALVHYSFVTDLFFSELGIGPSQSMRELYRDIIKAMHHVQVDINIVKEELSEPEQAAGAFYCEYEVFKNLYRLEARTASRSGKNVFIMLLTVSDPEYGMPDAKVLSKVMDGLFDIIRTSLRKGDAFSWFSATQYVLMLSALTCESCAVAADRIIKRYKESRLSDSMDISVNIQTLDPVESEAGVD